MIGPDDLEQILITLDQLTRRVRKLEIQEHSGTIGPGAGGAPANATYVTMTLDPSLPFERTLAEGPGIDVVDGGANADVTVGMGGDTILLYDSAGAPIAEFDATAAGLALALAAATSGDILKIPAVTITGNHTITDGVKVVGESRYATILTGQITGGVGSSIENLTITREFNDATDVKCVVGPASSGTFKIHNCDISATQNGSGDAFGVYVDVGSTNVEIWNSYVYAHSGSGNGYAGWVDTLVSGVIYIYTGYCYGSTSPFNT